MHIWVLILTLTGGYQGGAALTFIKGIESQQRCEQIGKAWISQDKIFRTYLCFDMEQ